MADAPKGPTTTQDVSEQQLVQMVQQEEQALLQKQSLIERINSLYRETVIAKDSLKEMRGTNGKVLINLGATVLVEVEAKNVTTCKRGYTENGYKEDTVEDTIAWLTKREEQLQKQLSKLMNEYSENEQRYTQLVSILKQIDTEKRRQYEQQRKQPPLISK